MNRRGFLQRLVLGAAAFTVLPAATTYQRVWKSVAPPEVLVACLNPEWVSAPYEMVFFFHEPHVWPEQAGAVIKPTFMPDAGVEVSKDGRYRVRDLFPPRYRDPRARPEDLIPPFILRPKKSC